MPATPAINTTLSAFARDVLNGLAARPRSIPSKYFYDERGSELFEQITQLDAYYPTRTERQILTTHAAQIAEEIGWRSALIEYGSGSSEKTRILLDALHSKRALSAYVPVDISADFLATIAEDLRESYPGLPILPVAADYSHAVPLPQLPDDTERRVMFFPGSTIGNLTPDEAQDFLREMAQMLGPKGRLILGSDLAKDQAVLELAYDDPEGVTAAFNKNLLVRMNRELEADATLDAWTHRALYNATEGRVEMHLVSDRDQVLRVGGTAFSFSSGESIHTENSYKYEPGALHQLASEAGFQFRTQWTDPKNWFAVESYHVVSD
ncbi:MAG: L-histidine N(alpha)-methyltransferase [Rubricoccaceae bacterium]